MCTLKTQTLNVLQFHQKIINDDHKQILLHSAKGYLFMAMSLKLYHQDYKHYLFSSKLCINKIKELRKNEVLDDKLIGNEVHLNKVA